MRRKGLDDDAVEAYRKSMERDPGNPAIYDRMASLLRELDRPDDAAAVERAKTRASPGGGEP